MKTLEDPELMEKEYYWRDRQKWLEERGYMLRPRYRPGWTASWIGTNKSSLSCEDGPYMKVRTPSDWIPPLIDQC
jgi:hypothetical protein